MTISIIAAVSENNIIGNKGKLPWRLSDDLKNFKELTQGHAVIMGRKTFESIGKPLPDRINIVLTRDPDYQEEGVLTASNFQDALKIAEKMQDDEVFIIGGQFVFNKALRYADKLYLTEVKGEVDGDVEFPSWDKKEWKEVSRKSHKKDNTNDYDFDIITYTKIA